MIEAFKTLWHWLSKGALNPQLLLTGTITVKRGDTLSGLALKHLGAGSRWKEIYDINRDKISDPNKIYPGQVLTLPRR